MSSWKPAGSADVSALDHSNKTRSSVSLQGLPPGITQEMLDIAKSMKAKQGDGGKSRAHARGAAPALGHSRGGGAIHPSSFVSRVPARGGVAAPGRMSSNTVGRRSASHPGLQSASKFDRSQVAAPINDTYQLSVRALPKSTVRMVSNSFGASSSTVGRESSVRIISAGIGESNSDVEHAPPKPTVKDVYVAPHLNVPSTMTATPALTASVSSCTKAATAAQFTSFGPNGNGPKPIVSNMVLHDPLEFVAAHFLRQKSAKQTEAEIEELVQKYKAEEGEKQVGSSNAVRQVSGSFQTTLRSFPNGQARSPISTKMNSTDVVIRDSAHVPPSIRIPMTVATLAEPVRTSDVHLSDGYSASLPAKATEVKVDAETTKTIKSFAPPAQAKKDTEFEARKAIKLSAQTPLLAQNTAGLRAWAAFASTNTTAQDATTSTPVSTVKTKEVHVASSTFLTPAYDKRGIASVVSTQLTVQKDNVPMAEKRTLSNSRWA